MRLRIIIFSISLLSSGVFANARQINRDKIVEDIEKNNCVTTEQETVKICKFDYKYKNQTVEALTFRPMAEGKFPALMLIPGYQGTATTYLSFGIIFAKLGFASLSIGTPGFGKTTLMPDFLGRHTINAFIEGYQKFQREPFVDKSTLGIFGYSRGAIAASLMIARLKNVKAAALGGGIYDLKKAYDELTIEGIKDNIKTETGLSKNAFKERSALFQARKINSSILIIHGEKDANAPPDQAYLLRDELKRLNKNVELQIIKGQDHRIDRVNLLRLILDFFSRQLKGKMSDVKIF